MQLTVIFIHHSTLEKNSHRERKKYGKNMNKHTKYTASNAVIVF